MAIEGSYERHPDLGCEALVFIDPESGACFQIQRDLPGGPHDDEHCVTTGMSAPVYGGVVQWRRVPPTGSEGERFEFALNRRATALFADDVISFEVVPRDGQTVDELAAHVERLLS
ncbi:MAG: hypothetical protein QM774_10170 [Gordonia sp. (in: high G+C Gram-positive bacteria)]|uniref:hypothetical protein n=1 Tax=Gordonia sp. (in: high G+C Gram-positive bacteria) TaxID=84139 RepID=UPI0039E71D5F